MTRETSTSLFKCAVAFSFASTGQVCPRALSRFGNHHARLVLVDDSGEADSSDGRVEVAILSSSGQGDGLVFEKVR